MVMSVGWNPYFKNEKITAVRITALGHRFRIVGSGMILME